MFFDYSTIAMSSVPYNLFRVYTSSSQSSFDDRAGFVAAYSSLFHDKITSLHDIDPSTLSAAVVCHLDWECRIPSSFVSTTSSYSKACILASTYSQQGRNAFIARIRGADISSPDHLPPVKAMDLVRELALVPLVSRKSRDESEWLVPSDIPLRAILDIRRYNAGKPTFRVHHMVELTLRNSISGNCGFLPFEVTLDKPDRLYQIQKDS